VELRRLGVENWENGKMRPVPELVEGSTTMILLRESSHTVAADIIAPGEEERNPGFGHAGRTPSAVVF